MTFILAMGCISDVSFLYNRVGHPLLFILFPFLELQCLELYDIQQGMREKLSSKVNVL